MNTRIILAVAAAFATGTAIAFQAALNGRAGAVIGPIKTGLLVNAFGGTFAAIVVLFAYAAIKFGIAPATLFTIDRSAVPVMRTLAWIGAAGVLGIVIIIGVSFSVQGVGVTAGLAAILLTQLLMGLIIDRFGVAGGAEVAVGSAIALNARRLAGVAAMALGVWLLIPRQG